MKLELKHLAPYLPYRLKILTKKWDVQVDKIRTMHDDFTCDSTINIGAIRNNYDDLHFPILRPLSDLTKDQYSFIYEHETDCESIYEWLKLDTKSKFCSKFSYLFWDELFHYHFDVFGLIEQGLAIDINTLIQ